MKFRRRLSPAAKARRLQRSVSSYNRALYEMLKLKGVEYEAEKQFGRYRVDVFVPSRNLVIEVDGSKWHHKKRDAIRDEYLKREFGVKVRHYGDDDVKRWKAYLLQKYGITVPVTKRYGYKRRWSEVVSDVVKRKFSDEHRQHLSEAAKKRTKKETVAA